MGYVWNDDKKGNPKMAHLLTARLRLLAVKGSPKVDEQDTSEDVPDIKTLTCLSLNNSNELELDDHQPWNLTQKDKNPSEGPISGTLAVDPAGNILKGKFVISVHNGRPKTRELFLTRDRISMSRERQMRP